MDIILESLPLKKDLTVFWWYQKKGDAEVEFDFKATHQIEKAYSIGQETGEIPNKIKKIEIKSFYFIIFEKGKNDQGELVGAGVDERIDIIRKKDPIEKHIKYYSKFIKK